MKSTMLHYSENIQHYIVLIYLVSDYKLNYNKRLIKNTRKTDTYKQVVIDMYFICIWNKIYPGFNTI